MEVFWWSILIFISRIADVSLGTIRIQMIASRRKYLAAIIGFFEILIFILVVGKVLQDSTDVISIIAYCAGFSCGTLVGVIIEEKLNRRVIQARIISKTKPYRVLEKVRDSKFGATVMTGEGIDGEIDIINVVLKEDRKKELEELVTEIDQSSFIVFHPLEQVKGGYFYSVKNKI